MGYGGKADDTVQPCSGLDVYHSSIRKGKRSASRFFWGSSSKILKTGMVADPMVAKSRR